MALSHAGIMSRTVTDVALMLDVLANQNSAETFSLRRHFTIGAIAGADDEGRRVEPAGIVGLQHYRARIMRCSASRNRCSIGTIGRAIFKYGAAFPYLFGVISIMNHLGNLPSSCGGSEAGAREIDRRSYFRMDMPRTDMSANERKYLRKRRGTGHAPSPCKRGGGQLLCFVNGCLRDYVRRPTF